MLGVVPPDLPLVPREAEVADVFEAPLAFLLARANHAERSGEYAGRRRAYHEIVWGDRRIWGATAGMIVKPRRAAAGVRVKLPRAGWRDDADLRALVAALGGDGAVRLVGGAVRDGLLGLPVADSISRRSTRPPRAGGGSRRRATRRCRPGSRTAR